jgi:hypothetical protein
VIAAFNALRSQAAHLDHDTAHGASPRPSANAKGKRNGRPVPLDHAKIGEMRVAGDGTKTAGKPCEL